jgi:hypothetical protein
MAPVTIIPATFIKVNSVLHTDAAQTRLVSGIRLVGSEGVGEVYKVVNGLVSGPIAVTQALGKDDSISCVINKAGDVICDVSEADPGGGGSTCAIRVYTFPALLPPSINSSGGSVDLIARSTLKGLLNSLSSIAQTLYAVCQNLIKTLP